MNRYKKEVLSKIKLDNIRGYDVMDVKIRCDNDYISVDYVIRKYDYITSIVLFTATRDLKFEVFLFDDQPDLNVNDFLKC